MPRGRPPRPDFHPDDPTPEEIARMAESIRASWSWIEELRRRGVPVAGVRGTYRRRYYRDDWPSVVLHHDTHRHNGRTLSRAS